MIIVYSHLFKIKDKFFKYYKLTLNRLIELNAFNKSNKENQLEQYKNN